MSVDVTVADRDADVTFCLIVPSGTWRIDRLVDAIRSQHPTAAIVAVWCGDPHRRPVLDRTQPVRWADLALDQPSGLGWGLLLASLPARAYEWCRATAVVDRLLQHTDAVVVLRVGSVAVLGPCDSLIDTEAPLTVGGRPAVPDTIDGNLPDLAQFMDQGAHSTCMVGFSASGRPALRWIGSQLAAGAEIGVGRVLDAAATTFGACVAGTDVVSAGWGSAPGPMINLVDLDHLDRDEPWHFTFGPGAARSRLSLDPAMAAAVAAGVDQLEGAAAPVELPGGIPLDGAMRRLVSATAVRWRRGDGALPPEPFGAASSGFLRWLEGSEPWTADIGRYWMAMREERADLLTIFPKPQSADVSRFREWIDAAWRLEVGRTSVLRPSGTVRHPIVDAGRDPGGVNVLGYIGFDQSQGHIAREIVAAFESSGMPVAALDHTRSQGARRDEVGSSDRSACFATNIVVVNPDQFEFVISDHGQSLFDGRRTIGYWFWELEDVPDSFHLAIDHVDEIWTGSQFIADAFARVTDKPVRSVPLPVSEPRPSSLTRSTMGLPDDGYVFLTTFDQFSVPERKNPFGTIDAFCRAFDEGDGPVLLIKTLNGSKGWRNHERLLLATSHRRDIIVWDEHLSRPDQMAVIAAADCLVSLHRSEGLGLHCAEAMWLGKPVIATAYSGNLDFMDDTVAAMIDYELIHVRHGEGIYPETAMWADPDLDQAAEWMRRLVADPSTGVALGARARARMMQQPSRAEAGRRMAELAGVRAAGTIRTDDKIDSDRGVTR